MQLATMNEALGITTLLLPAKPGLAAMSSTVGVVWNRPRPA